MSLGRRSFIGALISASVLAGCSFSSKYMRPVSGPFVIQPVVDRATVVFIRPSSFGAAIKPTIVDGRGRFMGDAEGSTFFVRELEPGPHLFLVWAENTGPLMANLLPGRVYFVEVAIKPGAWTARAHLLAIAPRTEQWANVREWLRDAEPRTSDVAAGNAYLAERRDDVGDRIQRAREAFGELDAPERDARTLRPEDGVAQGFTR
ncbi:MAG: hypothetical protein HYV09_41080 [Deltaproteobacteria bacterium]|nr:hypothetical protein [Deltaproteobacteria bacterium]